MVLKAISTTALPLRQWPGPGEWTYQDYLDLPDDGYRYEIIWGELYMTPAPSTRHQRISRNLEFALWDYVKKHDLGEVLDAPCDVVMEPGATPVQPDLLFVAKERLKIITAKNVNGAPDLLVEILSSGSREYDQVTKFDLYAQAGVAEYWIIDPQAGVIEVFVLAEGVYARLGRFSQGETAKSKVLAGFTVAVAEVIGVQ
jgi:Uma2 family endonuclease